MVYGILKSGSPFDPAYLEKTLFRLDFQDGILYLSKKTAHSSESGINSPLSGKNTANLQRLYVGCLV